MWCITGIPRHANKIQIMVYFHIYRLTRLEACAKSDPTEVVTPLSKQWVKGTWGASFSNCICVIIINLIAGPAVSFSWAKFAQKSNLGGSVYGPESIKVPAFCTGCVPLPLFFPSFARASSGCNACRYDY